MIPMFSTAAVNDRSVVMAAVERVVESQRLILGGECAAFEQEFGAYLGFGEGHCAGVANGTDALELALRALGVHVGASVVTTANAGFYASAAIHAIGATPVYADVDDTTLTLCPEALSKVLAVLPARPAAIVVTHLYGRLAEMGALVAIAENSGIALVEDCAQAHGARRAGRAAGSFGALGCFSFYPTKNLGAVGDGGAVVSRDRDLIERIRALRQYGWASKYRLAIPYGRNSRLDEIQAAVLRDKLPLLEDWNAERRAIAGRYDAAFADLEVVRPGGIDEDYVGHLYVLRVGDRDGFRSRLAAEGIASDVHYPVPDHLQEHPRGGIVPRPLTVTEAASRQVVSLPCFPGLSPDDVEAVVTGVRRAAIGLAASERG